MLRHVEPTPGDHRCIVALAQQVIVALRIAAADPSRKGGDAMVGGRSFEIAAIGHNVVECGAVALE
jgi:hypothetical protein